MSNSDLSGFVSSSFSGRIVRKTPLVLAAALGAVLLSGCRDQGTPDEPIFSLVRDNNASRVGQYLAEGGDPNTLNSEGDNLLYVASGARGGIEVVNLLLLAGADLDRTSNQGRTPLHTAAAWCNADIVEALLNAGARTDIVNSENKIALDVVCARPRERREQVIALFLKVGG